MKNKYKEELKEILKKFGAENAFHEIEKIIDDIYQVAYDEGCDAEAYLNAMRDQD